MADTRPQTAINRIKVLTRTAHAVGLSSGRLVCRCIDSVPAPVRQAAYTVSRNRNTWLVAAVLIVIASTESRSWWVLLLWGVLCVGGALGNRAHLGIWRKVFAPIAGIRRRDAGAHDERRAAGVVGRVWGLIDAVVYRYVRLNDFMLKLGGLLIAGGVILYALGRLG